MSPLIALLREFGFGEKEALVYLAACELGASSAQDIAQKSGVNRATVYACLEALQKRGRVSSSTVSGRTVFLATSPERLLESARDEVAAAQQKEERLREGLPRLVAIYNVEGNKPDVMFLEGVEALQGYMEEMEQLHGSYVQITNVDDAAKAFLGYEKVRRNHHERFRAKEISGRSLLVSAQPFESLKLAKLPTAVRVLPLEQFPIHGEISVREDRLLLMSFSLGMSATIVRSKTIADTFRSVFDLAWAKALEYPGFTEEECLSWPDTGRVV